MRMIKKKKNEGIKNGGCCGGVFLGREGKGK